MRFPVDGALRKPLRVALAADEHMRLPVEGVVRSSDDMSASVVRTHRIPDRVMNGAPIACVDTPRRDHPAEHVVLVLHRLPPEGIGDGALTAFEIELDRRRVRACRTIVRDCEKCPS